MSRSKRRLKGVPTPELDSEAGTVDVYTFD
jgi:hypothetical protein